MHGRPSSISSSVCASTITSIVSGDREITNVQSHHICKGVCNGRMRTGHRVVHHWRGRQSLMGRVGPAIQPSICPHILALSFSTSLTVYKAVPPTIKILCTELHKRPSTMRPRHPMLLHLGMYRWLLWTTLNSQSLNPGLRSMPRLAHAIGRELKFRRQPGRVIDTAGRIAGRARHVGAAAATFTRSVKPDR